MFGGPLHAAEGASMDDGAGGVALDDGTGEVTPAVTLDDADDAQTGTNSKKETRGCSTNEGAVSSGYQWVCMCI